MRILVTGGAGYIGSHTCKALAAAGYEPVTFDNMSTGNAWAVRWGPVVKADLSDSDSIQKALADYRPEGVIHFAASAYVGESTVNPRKYFRNNVVNSLNLLDAMVTLGVQNIVFSSSCATYGVPSQTPIPESHPQVPVNPYGESKLFVERTLKWYASAYGLRCTALRYFNAAGADRDGEIGELHTPETHLIPLALMAALGQIEKLRVFGTDYPTLDGTCIRDYIHVEDLANAHIKALRTISSHSDGLFQAYNLGTGRGHSVKEVIAVVERVTGLKVPVDNEKRRIGDPPVLIAATDGALRLGWMPQWSELTSIVESAWHWVTLPKVPSHKISGANPDGKRVP